MLPWEGGTYFPSDKSNDSVPVSKVLDRAGSLMGMYAYEGVGRSLCRYVAALQRDIGVTFELV